MVIYEKKIPLQFDKLIKIKYEIAQIWGLFHKRSKQGLST